MKTRVPKASEAACMFLAFFPKDPHFQLLKHTYAFLPIENIFPCSNSSLTQFSQKSKIELNIKKC